MPKKHPPLPEFKQKIRYDRAVAINPGVKVWRQRKELFKTQQKRVLEYAIAYCRLRHLDPAVWLKTSNQGLGGQAPRAFMNPKQISGLLSWLEKLLKDASESRE